MKINVEKEYEIMRINLKTGTADVEFSLVDETGRKITIETLYLDSLPIDFLRNLLNKIIGKALDKKILNEEIDYKALKTEAQAEIDAEEKI